MGQTAIVTKLLLVNRYTRRQTATDKPLPNKTNRCQKRQTASTVYDLTNRQNNDFKHTLKQGKDDLSLVKLGSHLRIEDSLRAQDSDKGKGKEVDGPSVNMTEEGKNKNNKQNKGKKRGFKENNSGSSSNKKPKLECWKCGKTGHFKRDCRSGNKKNANAGGSGKGVMQLHGGLIPVLQLIF
ncbi:zinc finger, CCHC-type containing protein, partial [Tanacetum coccineum]